MPFMPQIRPAGSHDPADRDERDHALRLGASGCRTVMASGRMSGSTIGLDIAKSVFQVVHGAHLVKQCTNCPAVAKRAHHPLSVHRNCSVPRLPLSRRAAYRLGQSRARARKQR